MPTLIELQLKWRSHIFNPDYAVGIVNQHYFLIIPSAHKLF